MSDDQSPKIQMTSLQRIMMKKGLQKNNEPQRKASQGIMKSSFGKSMRSTSETPISRKSPQRKSDQEEPPKTNGSQQVFGRSALIKTSFFSKDSRPVGKSPIFDHSPFLNKTLLNGKKEPKKMTKSAAALYNGLGMALEQKIYNATFQMYMEKDKNVRSSVNSNESQKDVEK